MNKLKVGDEVMVQDAGLHQLYAIASKSNPDLRPSYFGWVNEINEKHILVEFPIGDEDPKEHSQVAPYPRHRVMPFVWSEKYPVGTEKRT